MNCVELVRAGGLCVGLLLDLDRLLGTNDSSFLKNEKHIKKTMFQVGLFQFEF